MSYAVLQDLIDRFGEEELIELTDRADPPTGLVDATIVAGALADADELINSYVARRYDLPLSPVPSRLVQMAANIARFNLYTDDPMDSVKESHARAINFLKDIAAGRAVLDVAGSEPAGLGSAVLTNGSAPTFTKKNMEGF